MAYDYDIFLSYRHKPLDGQITQKTFNMLESYKMPDHLKKRGFKGVSRVFRDTEELAVSRVLSNTIDEALRSTNCLVVVCSPDTPSSEWVDREVETFIELGRAEKIFPLLIAGDPEISFPPSLKKVPDIMDRMMDVRCSGDDVKKITAKEDIALLRVLSEVSGCHFADLIRYHKIRKTGRFATLSACFVALFALVGLVSGMLWTMAETYKAAAQKEQSASMNMLESLTYDLPNSLVELPGTYGRVSDILDKNVTQIINILKLSDNEDNVAIEMGANYEKLARASTVLGNRERAVLNQELAIETYRSVYEKGDQEALILLASAWNNMGVSHNAAGFYEEADEAYTSAVSLQEEILSADRSYDAIYNMATFLNNSGTNKLALGEYTEAIGLYKEGYELYEELFAEGYAEVTSLLAQTCQNLGICFYQVGNYTEAQPWLEKSVELSGIVFEKNPNRTNLTILAQLQGTLATSLSLQARFGEAVRYFELAIKASELLAGDAENMEAQNNLAVLYNNYGLYLNMSSLYDAAEEQYMKRVRLQENIYEALGTPLSQAGLARACFNVAENAFKAGRYDMAREYYDRCLALYGPVSEELGDYHRAEYLARLAYYQIIVTNDFAGAYRNAAAAYQLQSDSSFILYILGYALMYNGYLDACDEVFSVLAARSEGEVVNVRIDFEALTKAGLGREHMDYVLELMGEISNR